MRWREAFEAVVDVVLPPGCAACDTVLPAPGAFCETCGQEVLELPAVHCRRCAEPGDFVGGECERCRAGVPFDQAWAPFEHEGAVAKAIHRLKYEDRSDLSRPLGVLLGRLASDFIERQGAVTLVPVPLHQARFRSRGYDQAAMLARSVAAVVRRPLELSWLTRISDTPRQVGLDESARAQNVRGAFAAPPVVAGARVVLLDDVLTSGATVREAALTLRRAGALHVGVLTLARARSLVRSGQATNR